MAVLTQVQHCTGSALSLKHGCVDAGSTLSLKHGCVDVGSTLYQCDLSYGFLVKVTVKVSRYNIFQLSYSYS